MREYGKPWNEGIGCGVIRRFARLPTSAGIDEHHLCAEPGRCIRARCRLGGSDRRASVSIMSNIAEGFERGTKTEFIQFLFIAKGSCGEVRAQVAIAHDQGYVDEAAYARLHDLARRVSGMLSNFIAHQQGSAYQGEKLSRPQRQTADSQRERISALRAAQLASTQATKEHERDDKPRT